MQLIFLETPAMIKNILEGFSISFNGSNIYPSKQVKNLGMTFDKPFIGQLTEFSQLYKNSHNFKYSIEKYI